MIAVLGLVGLEPILVQAITGWQDLAGFVPRSSVPGSVRVLELEFSAGDGQPLHVTITNARVVCFADGPPLLTLPWCDT